MAPFPVDSTVGGVHLIACPALRFLGAVPFNRIVDAIFFGRVYDDEVVTIVFDVRELKPAIGTVRRGVGIGVDLSLRSAIVV